MVDSGQHFHPGWVRFGLHAPVREGSFAPIVKEVAPAVVKIETTTTLKNTSIQGSPGLEDPFWKHFFGNQPERSFPQQPHGPQMEHGLGSGVIITKDEDFLYLANRPHQTGMVVWVRVGNCRNSMLLALVEKALPEILEALNTATRVVEIR